MSIKNLPLFELHFHFDGSVTIPIARKLAELQNIKLPGENDEELEKKMTVGMDCTSLVEFLKCFDIPGSLLQTKEGISEGIYLEQEFLKSKGVEYAEIRLAPQFHIFKGLTQEEVFQACLDGLKRSTLHTNLIACIMRVPNNKEANWETLRVLKKYLVEDNGFVALDIAGAEKEYPIKLYEEEFKFAREQNIPFTIHAGEADGPESVNNSLDLGTKRIGHGVRTILDQKVLDRVINENVTFEMAPTSNVITKAVNKIEDFPILEYLKQGVKFTINTDDMAICRTDIRKEWEFMIKTFNLKQEDINQILRNSIDAAFTTAETKAALHKKLEEKIKEL